MSEILGLNRAAVGAVGSFETACGCGSLHTVRTNAILFGAGVSRHLGGALEKIVPPLSAVLIVSDESVRTSTSRYFEKAIARFGYRIRLLTYPQPPEASLEQAYAVQSAEDTRLIIGVGGGTICELTKYIAARQNLPCVYIATDPAMTGALTPSALIEAGGVEELYKTPPCALLVCDTDFLNHLPAQSVPAALGGLASKAVSLFDYMFSARVNGEKFCRNLWAAASAGLDETLEQLQSGNQACAAQIIAEGSIRHSAYSALMGNSRLLNGGEAQIAHVLKLLLRHEARPALLRGELEMLGARTAVKLYQSVLKRVFCMFVPPPDNNARLRDAVEFLGLEELTVMRKLRPLTPVSAMRLCAYRLGEYRSELLEEAMLAQVRIDKAFRLFKRLYPDDGFGLIHAVDASDIAFAVRLAPDLKEKYTMLTYMKDEGLLEDGIGAAFA